MRRENSRRCRQRTRSRCAPSRGQGIREAARYTQNCKRWAGDTIPNAWKRPVPCKSLLATPHSDSQASPVYASVNWYRFTGVAGTANGMPSHYIVGGDGFSFYFRDADPNRTRYRVCVYRRVNDRRAAARPSGRRARRPLVRRRTRRRDVGFPVRRLRLLTLVS